MISDFWWPQSHDPNPEVKRLGGGQAAAKVVERQVKGNVMGIWWEYYGDMVGIWWEYDGNMMGIGWFKEYDGNIFVILR